MKTLKIKAPGRINLLGEHLDYNHGIVLPAAINRYFEFEFSTLEGSLFLIEALDLNEKWEFTWTELTDSTTNGWMNYVKGVFLLIGFTSHPPKALHVRFKSNIPIGAGLSSSAALCCGLAFGLNEFYQLGKTRHELALLAQQTEHEFTGVKCGLMDQVASLFGQANHLLAFDCISHEINSFELPLHSAKLFLIDSKIKHNLAESAYNERRASMEYAWLQAIILFPNLKSWRDIKGDQKQQLLSKLDRITSKRLTYVLDELVRVQKVQHLTKDLTTCSNSSEAEPHLIALGQYLNQTHLGLRDLYEVSCQELNFLQQAFTQLSGVYGARMMGGGFGGCLLVLASNDFTASVAQSLMMEYFLTYDVYPAWIDVQLSVGVEVF